MHKTYISANELLDDAYRLAAKVIDSGFRPSFVLALWRGGTPVGVAVQELFEYCNIPVDHIAIRTSLYSGLDQRERKVRVHNLHYLLENCGRDDALLIVDDVYDTGLTIKAVLETIAGQAGDSAPKDIRVAVPWFKPGRNQTDRAPDYYLHETDDWLVFPHELCGLSDEELRQNKPEVFKLLSALKG